ncbi:MAG: hypothetical protein HY744_00935 [Deltaproteobacteria bacterium]|nr:hypothetical protein [Deltaproteobacteria bacterium]
MVGESAWILEGFALQAAPGDRLTAEGVRAAVQAWVERVFPGEVLPGIALELWTGPQGVSHDLLELLLADTRLELREIGPTEIEPDSALAQPAYEEAA